MANFIAICGEFVNLDKVCHISVYTRTDNTVIIEVEYEHSIKNIPCAGTEDEVRNDIRWAIGQVFDTVPIGPAHISEVT